MFSAIPTYSAVRTVWNAAPVSGGEGGTPGVTLGHPALLPGCCACACPLLVGGTALFFFCFQGCLGSSMVKNSLSGPLKVAYHLKLFHLRKNFKSSGLESPRKNVMRNLSIET